MCAIIHYDISNVCININIYLKCLLQLLAEFPYSRVSEQSTVISVQKRTFDLR